MNHYLFDALKISPVPLETANKVTEVGWMLEIEKILNDILLKADKKYDDLSDYCIKVVQELKEDIEKTKEEFIKYPESTEYINKVFDSLKDKIVKCLNELMCDSLQYITFGLEDGYFCAYVPDNFSVEFDTILDPTDEDYGKLIVKY